VAVRDPYRWLEETSSGDTIRWLRGQQEIFEAYVAGVPLRKAARRRVLELSADGPFLAPVKAAGRFFMLRAGVNGGARSLWVQDGENAAPRLLVDPDRLLPGRDATLAGFAPSPDGRLVACAVSEQQSSWLRIRLFETERGVERNTKQLEANTLSTGIT